MKYKRIFLLGIVLLIGVCEVNGRKCKVPQGSKCSRTWMSGPKLPYPQPPEPHQPAPQPPEPQLPEPLLPCKQRKKQCGKFRQKCPTLAKPRFAAMGCWKSSSVNSRKCTAKCNEHHVFRGTKLKKMTLTCRGYNFKPRNKFPDCVRLRNVKRKGPQTRKPKTLKPKTPKPKTRKPKTRKPKTPKPETRKPKTPKPKTRKPKKPKPPGPQLPKHVTPVPLLPRQQRKKQCGMFPQKCPTLPKPRFAAMRCQNSPSVKKCTAMCFGHRVFRGTQVKKMVLTCTSYNFKPRNRFPDCVRPQKQAPKPKAPKPKPRKPKASKPKPRKPKAPKPKPRKPKAPKPKPRKPKTPKPKPRKPKTPKPKIRKPKTPKPQYRKPKTRKPKIRKPKTPKPKTRKPKKPKPQLPKSVTPVPLLPSEQRKKQCGMFPHQCPMLTQPRFAAMRCRNSPSVKQCTAECMGHHIFKGTQLKKMTLTCTDYNFKPRKQFPECVRNGKCRVKLVGAGKIKCRSHLNTIECKISCDGRNKGPFLCKQDGGWTPSLPRCVKPLGNPKFHRSSPKGLDQRQRGTRQRAFRPMDQRQRGTRQRGFLPFYQRERGTRQRGFLPFYQRERGTRQRGFRPFDQRQRGTRQRGFRPLDQRQRGTGLRGFGPFDQRQWGTRQTGFRPIDQRQWGTRQRGFQPLDQGQRGTRQRGFRRLDQRQWGTRQRGFRPLDQRQ